MKKLVLFTIGVVAMVCALLSVDAQNQDIRRGGGSGGNGITNTFNANQFTLTGGTNVNIKDGVLITNAVFYTTATIEGGGNFILATGQDNWDLQADFPNLLKFNNGGTNIVTWYPDYLEPLRPFILGTTTNRFSRVYATNYHGSGYDTTLAAGVATNVIDMNLSSSTNILDAALTIAHATNGVAGVEKTHVRWLLAGGADRAFAIPSGWRTNVYSAVPANITNNTITKMYVTTWGDTSSSANQTNVFVSFEYYK